MGEGVLADQANMLLITMLYKATELPKKTKKQDSMLIPLVKK
jgi:hypothetical protein